MPKLNKYIKNEDSQDKLRDIADEKAQSNIKLTVEAIERHAMLGCIALGLLQIISLLFAKPFSRVCTRFTRTKSKAILSEATVAHFMRKNIYVLFRFLPDLSITRIISERQLVGNTDDFASFIG